VVAPKGRKKKKKGGPKNPTPQLKKRRPEGNLPCWRKTGTGGLRFAAMGEALVPREKKKGKNTPKSRA